ncbi:single-stranded DNA-binding protein [Schaalia sp. Marseille-Q2122]|uniref:single-stranded DNA-binding protein n=1 Tax=Schaalia sp. Marseille-Q2122 TaxID=2736604 RepID=UPI00158D9EF4|nr:single-stranded DNA-binding protein [Schaalia sp. Marseille-Q2122]
MTDSATLTFRARVGSDLTSGRTTRGVPVVRFRIAVPQWRRTDSGDYEDLEPRWYTVRAWDRLALNLGTSLTKGQPVIVVGRPVANAWVDSAGQIHSEIVINASSIGHDLSQGSAMFFRRGQAPHTNDPSAEGTASSSTNEANARASSAATDADVVGEETPVERTHIGEHHSDVEDADFLTSSDHPGTENSDDAVAVGSGEPSELMSDQGAESVFADAYYSGGAA